MEIMNEDTKVQGHKEEECINLHLDLRVDNDEENGQSKGNEATKWTKPNSSNIQERTKRLKIEK
ncbi:hypothetical protein H5410_002938 [Solanum commersonii]|uniref:Uncharacterized protein n=1 Tax=Solanum commersonii TaxID=4109 RepID=A0A9J6B389_SOLCO|nr:hypothetical protein H5410_002938 [Solanum commersonii]